MFKNKQMEDRDKVLERVAVKNDLLWLKGHMEDDCAVGIWIYDDEEGKEQTARFTMGEVKNKRIELDLEQVQIEM